MTTVQAARRLTHLPDLSVHPPPFTRNPSAWDQRVPIAVLALVGFILSSYMALYQWGLVNWVYDPLFGDGTVKVLGSKLSQSMHRYMRMPDAALGALAYLGDAVFGMAGSTRRWQYRPWLVLIFGFDVIPLGIVSIALVVAQGTIVGSWCSACLISALISLVLIVMAYDEVWASIQYLRRVYRRSRSFSEAWRVFCGRPSQVGEEVALMPMDHPCLAPSRRT